MGFKIISAKDFAIKLKAAIHSTGKLGFTEATAKELSLTKNSFVKFAIDESDSKSLYLINGVDPDEEAFKVMSAGNYFSINTKQLFDSLGYDYKTKNIIFDMIKEKQYEERDVYKLLTREAPRKQKQN